MNTDELRCRLEEFGIHERYYWLDQGIPNERHCIQEEEGGWIVFYAEKGMRISVDRFSDENEAIVEFVYRLFREKGLVNRSKLRTKAFEEYLSGRCGRESLGYRDGRAHLQTGDGSFETAFESLCEILGVDSRDP